jgi:riboflavin synthase
MFTGIVEATARVREMRRNGGGARVVIDAVAAFDREAVRVGDSVAVNGVCLTVAAFDRGTFAADLSAETLARTTLGRLAPETAVNIERPVPVAGRLGGHIVQGHVDGVGRVVALREETEMRRLEITAPADLARYIVDKGSVAVDGVSLTVAGVTGNRFGVALIPHTCEVTTLGSLEPGREVNLEVDILAKYVERLAGFDFMAAGRKSAGRLRPGRARRGHGRRRPGSGRRKAVRKQ